MREEGFTLVEVMVVVIILAVLGAVAVPNLLDSAQTARVNADIATGHQLKTALDRYYLEHGHYPKLTAGNNGSLSSAGFIPEYISKLNSQVTQQRAADSVRGFGVYEINGQSLPAELGSDLRERLIMVYQNSSGAWAEVVVFNSDLTEILWSSAQ